MYFTVAILAILQIAISNQLSTYGKKITMLNQETNDIELANERLKKKIASDSAVFNLTLKAKELGFEKKAEVIYLNDLYSVAQNSLQ